MKPENKHPENVVVIGGGSSGIGIAASIRKRVKNIDITIVEPNDWHYYQPAWTPWAAGLDINKTRCSLSAVLPAGTAWVQDSVIRVEPSQKYIVTRQGQKINYDFLIVAWPRFTLG